jgi:hypothetical protein
LLSVGFLEEGDAPWTQRFDAVVVAPRARRDEDPCERLRKRAWKPT